MQTSSTRSDGTPRINVPLWKKPQLFQMGVGVHGLTVRTDRFRLPGLWCLHFYQYRGRLRLDDLWLEIAPGDVGITPPNCDIEYVYGGRSEHLYAHFSLGSITRKDEESDKPSGIEVPLLQHIDNADLWRDWQQCVGFGMAKTARAEVRLWDVLWQVAEHNQSSLAGVNAVVERAQKIIELKLSERIVVAELARELDLSHNHLTRLFHTHCGQTVVAYVASRRVERARHLLAHSTLPIKAVASQVGVHNLQDFNKMLRRHAGQSPRALRGTSSTRR